MSDIHVYKNFTYNSISHSDPNFRQAKTFQTPLLGLLLAATILVKSSQAKPYFFGHGQSPWIPLKPIYNLLRPIPSLWHPIPGNYYSQYHGKYVTTTPPQIQPPPLNQQQIIHISDILPSNKPTNENFEPFRQRNHYEITTNINHFQHAEENTETSERNLFDDSVSDNTGFALSPLPTENESLESQEDDDDVHIDYDNKADASNVSYSIVNLVRASKNETEENITNVISKENDINESFLELDSIENFTESTTPYELFETENVNDYSITTNKRSRRTTPRTIAMRRNSARRPVPDYGDFRNRNRKTPSRRRTTTPIYDDYNFSDKHVNHRRRRPPSKTKNRPNRRPINKETEYYDGDYKNDEEDYDDYYHNGVNVFARQGIDEDTTTTTTEAPTPTPTETTTTTQPTSKTTSTTGFSYGPPVHTGYGAPDHTGYGPSNGNEHISITYPPISGSGGDVLAPLIDALYNQYSKNSVIKRLQELLQPNNFYNNQQYDVNYPDNF